MSMVVADRIEALAAHGLRLTDHTRAETAVISAASARTAAGSRMSMACLPNHEGPLCSLIVPCRKMESARYPLAVCGSNALTGLMTLRAAWGWFAVLAFWAVFLLFSLDGHLWELG
jgi:hypothetical protein